MSVLGWCKTGSLFEYMHECQIIGIAGHARHSSDGMIGVGKQTLTVFNAAGGYIVFDGAAKEHFVLMLQVGVADGQGFTDVVNGPVFLGTGINIVPQAGKPFGPTGDDNGFCRNVV